MTTRTIFCDRCGERADTFSRVLSFECGPLRESMPRNNVGESSIDLCKPCSNAFDEYMKTGRQPAGGE